MEEVIATLYKEKKVLKCKFTKEINQAKAALDKGEVPASSTLRNIRGHVKDLKLVFHKIQVHVADDDDQLENCIEEEAAIQDKYQNIKSLLNASGAFESRNSSEASFRSVVENEFTNCQYDKVLKAPERYHISAPDSEISPLTEKLTIKADIHEPPRSLSHTNRIHEYRPRASSSSIDEDLNQNLPHLQQSTQVNTEQQRWPHRNVQNPNSNFSGNENISQNLHDPIMAHMNQGNNFLSHASMPVKLEPLKMKEFDGSYENWETFRDSYEALIHFSNQMHDIEKFQRLEQLISKGQAKSFLNQVMITGSNYQSVWADMKRYYDNERRIVTAHINGLFDIRPIKDERASSLREVLDTFRGHLRALKTIGQDQNAENYLLQILLLKLDGPTRCKWEGKLSTTSEVPKLQTLYDLIEKRIKVLEAVTPDRRSIAKPKSNNFAIAKTSSCKICDETDHIIYKCEKFQKFSPAERLHCVKTARLCFNCLQEGHSTRNCTSGNCRVKNCKSKHNTLLHDSFVKPSTTSNVVTLLSKAQKEVLLSTAKLYAIDDKGRPLLIRALIDCCSQENFVSSHLLRKLSVPTTPMVSTFTGIGMTESQAKEISTIQIRSCHSEFEMTLDFVIMNDITEQLPSQFMDVRDWNIPSTIKLADPSFNRPGRIDMLLSAEVFFNVILDGKFELGNEKPRLVNTSLGWIVGGAYSNTASVNMIKKKPINCAIISMKSLSEQLERFWTVENCEKEDNFRSAQDEFVEKHFLENYTFDSNRFCVRLPFIVEPTKLGQSRKRAEASWLSMER